MDELIRNFVAPRLGRGSVTTTIDDDGNGTVRISFNIAQDEPAKSALFVINSDKLHKLKLDGLALAFSLSRIAISQAQKLFMASKMDDLTIVELDPAVSPWNGDLAEAPYGGATAGCKLLFEQQSQVIAESVVNG